MAVCSTTTREATRDSAPGSRSRCRAKTQWLKQELASPRVPIVRTVQRNGDVEIVEETFALAPPLAAPGQEAELFLERVDSQAAQTGWAAPPAGSDPAFSNIALGSGHAVQYRFKAGKAARYTVVFGLCEGYHAKPGQRILTLQVEGKPLRTVDLVAEKGRNQPEVYSFPARDENGDGWIDLAVAAATNSPDKNTILNTLWVFAGSDLPPKEELLAGRSARAAAGSHRLRHGFRSGQAAAPRCDAHPAAQHGGQRGARRARLDDRERLAHYAGRLPPARADRRVDQPGLLAQHRRHGEGRRHGRCCTFRKQ